MQGKRLHDHDRQPFRETGQHHRLRGEDFLPNLFARHPAGQLHVRIQLQRTECSANTSCSGPPPMMTTVNDRPWLRSSAAAPTRMSWPFCSDNLPMLTNRGSAGGELNGVPRYERIDAAMHHVDFVPIVEVGPTPNLTAAERRDGDHESRVLHFGAAANWAAISNSSGPWIVRLYGGPPRSRHKSATVPEFVAK